MNVNWWDIIIPYLSGSVAILYCPTVRSYTPPYLLNGALGYLEFHPQWCFLGAVTEPAETILVMEGRPPRESMPPNVRWVAFAASFTGPLRQWPFHHFGKMNACFVDGHVRLRGAEELDLPSPLWYPEK